MIFMRRITCCPTLIRTTAGPAPRVKELYRKGPMRKHAEVSVRGNERLMIQLIYL